jgi:hypothetical protein
MFQRVFSTLLLCSLLVMQFADCTIVAQPDKQEMQCCGAMPCSTASRSQDCCAKMTPTQLPSALPSGRIALAVPTFSVVPWRPLTDAAQFAPRISCDIQVQTNSPPDLYTLEHSLLI